MTPMIQSHTATVCALMQLNCPQAELAPPLAEVLAAAPGRPLAKALIFAPDALGQHLYRHDAGLFAAYERECSLRIRVQAEMPSVTPVCFASIFTGLAPSAHGINHYTKPVLTCATLFDYALQAGRQVAIVAVADSSIDRIFRQRALDYFSEPDDAGVTQRCLELLAADRHDLILVYQQAYDDTLHAQTPFSPAALQAAADHADAFSRIAAAAHAAWAAYDRLLAVIPDHGAHFDSATGKGDHGLAIAEDLEVNHFYGIFAGQIDAS